MRTFTAYRPQKNAPDAPQFEGCIFSDGRVAVRWRTAVRSFSIWDSLQDLMDIHGHAEYGTFIIWDNGYGERYLGEGKFEQYRDKHGYYACACTGFSHAENCPNWEELF